MSWKSKIKLLYKCRYSHPPCEDVSWKTSFVVYLLQSDGSSSLWGCELKNTQMLSLPYAVKSSSLWGCELKSFCVKWIMVRYIVILLVRMWVEKIVSSCLHPVYTSSSLWGCELKSVRFHWLGFAQHVILLVRMWVEKWSIWNTYRQGLCHPPCEDVSWKGLLPKSFALSASSSSMWGCELKRK